VNIVFGTDGWRARIADEYTFDAVRVCAQSVAEWVVKNGGADRIPQVTFDELKTLVGFDDYYEREQRYSAE